MTRAMGQSEVIHHCTSNNNEHEEREETNLYSRWYWQNFYTGWVSTSDLLWLIIDISVYHSR